MTKKISSQTLNLNFSLFCDPIHSLMNNKSSMGEFTQNSAAWHIFDGVRVRFYPFSHCKIKWQHSNEKHQIILTALGNFWVFWIVYTQFPITKAKMAELWIASDDNTPLHRILLDIVKKKTVKNTKSYYTPKLNI